MAKKKRIAAVSRKLNNGKRGKLSKTRQKTNNTPQKSNNLPRKRKISSEKTEGVVPKKVKFSLSNKMAPGSKIKKLESPIADSEVTKRQKRENVKTPRFMKPELRTIKKTGTVFDKVKLTASGKPNWSELKKESLKLKKERKERKQPTHFEIILEVKKIWEVARQETCPVDKRVKELLKLHSLMENQLSKLVFAHDTSRIVQGLLKLGSPTVRTSICDELAPLFVEMMQAKFSSFVLRAILKYGDEKDKAKVLLSMKGCIVKLMSNSIASPLVEQVYLQVASTEQKLSMEKEFLGNFLITVSQATESLGNILKALSTENKAAIFDTIKENIVKVIDKGNVCSSLLCSVTMQFVSSCSEDDKQEVLPLFAPHIVEVVATKPGTQVGMQCVWFSDKKVKKQIVKAIKGKLLTLATSEISFWLILAVLDAVDDTVLLNKVVVSEIADNATTLLKSEHGRKVLLYLVAHRDPVYFHPKDLENLKQADSNCLKSIDRKREELSPIVYDLLQRISKEIQMWMGNAKVAMVTLAILKRGQGETLCESLSTIAKYICSDVTIDGQPLIENPGMNMMLKKLLRVDETRKDDIEKFSVQLAAVLEAKTIKKWVSCNRGAFLLVGIIETKSDKAIKTLMTKITHPLKKHICKETNIGAKVLVRVLKEADPDFEDGDGCPNLMADLKLT